jgi:hypothetical protein
MNACEICPDSKKCPRRSNSEIPRSSRLKRSVYEKSHGKITPHHLIVKKEVGLYSGHTSSGDACRIIQEVTWGSGKPYLRFGYYVWNPDKGTWRWGQSSPLIQEGEYKELVKRAKKAHIMS